MATPGNDESTSSSRVIPSQFDYKTQLYAGAKYKYTRVVPLSGSTNVTMSTNSTVEVTFEIPRNVLNFAKSYITGTIAIPAPGGALATWMYADTIPFITELELQTRSSIKLCSIPQFGQYIKIVRKLGTCLKEYQSNDMQTLLYPSGVNPDVVPAITPANGVSSVISNECAYAINNQDSLGAAAGAASYYEFEIPFGAIKNTLLSYDKDLCFPEILVLRLLISSGQSMLWNSTTNASPYTGAAPIAVAPAINSLTLYMALETNVALAQMVMDTVNSERGLNIMIDYPYCYKNVLNGSSQNISLRFNRSQGVNIKKIVTIQVDEEYATSGGQYNMFNCASEETDLPIASSW